MKPEQSKFIIENVKRRGYVLIGSTYYPPNSPHAIEFLSQPHNTPKNKQSRLKRIKTGWIDDTLNIKNKSTKFNPFITLIRMRLNLDVWTEFIFSIEKNYKFDYAIPIAIDGKPIKIAIEVDGGTKRFTISGHNSPAGLERDRLKGSLAASEGWTMLRVTPDQLCTEHTIGLIIKSIQSKSN